MDHRAALPPKATRQRFAKVPVEILSAPKHLLSPSAKVIDGVLASMPSAWRDEEIFLTQVQISQWAGLSLRTVQEGIKQLQAVGRVTITDHPAANGFVSHSYRLVPVEKTELPPRPVVVRSSERVRDLLSARQNSRQEANLPNALPTDCIDSNYVPQGAESAQYNSRQRAQAVGEFRRQRETQEEVIDLSQRRTQRDVCGPMHLSFQDSEIHLELSDKYFNQIAVAEHRGVLEMMATELEIRMRSLPIDLDDLNTSLRRLWVDDATTRVNVQIAAAYVRDCLAS